MLSTGTYVGSGASLTLTFTSDGSVTRSGFFAVFTSERPPLCSSATTVGTGSFSFTTAVQRGTLCYYIMQATPAHRVQVRVRVRVTVRAVVRGRRRGHLRVCSVLF